LDETTTSRFSKKIDTCRKESDFTCEYPLEDFEKCWTSMMARDRSDRFVIFWLGKLAIEETIDNINERLRSANFKERLGHHIR
jgi:hypothetical protein